MTMDERIQPVPGIPSDPLVRQVASKPAGLPEVQGADFSRILQELMDTAGKLDARASQAPSEDPQALTEAVAEAKQSLDTAMSLSESLLEAYRRTLITDPARGNKP